MKECFRTRYVIGFIVVASALVAGPVASEPTPADLQKLWEHHMLEGKSSAVGVMVTGSTISISESQPKKLLSEVKNDLPSMLYLEPYGITVQKLGEGFWGNGGWYLLGGLLDEVSVGPSRIQLYAETVEHHHSQFIIPFLFRILFHRDDPIDTGYQFFLLHRTQGIAGAKIIRTWVIPPDEVVLIDVGHGGAYPNVRAGFSFDSTIRTATVHVSGLKNPIEERVDLTSELEGEPQKTLEPDRANP